MKKMKSLLLFVVFGLLAGHLQSQTRKTENLLLIGWDGVRWQEIFTGVDSSLMNDRPIPMGRVI